MGWAQTQAAYLEALELKQGVPPSHANAARLLRDRAIDVMRVVQVDTDCVLFLGAAGEARTAWLKRDGSRIRALLEDGFAAWPSERTMLAMGVARADARDMPASETAGQVESD